MKVQVSLLAVFTLLGPLFAASQDRIQESWSNVQRVRADQKVRILRTDGRAEKGSFGHVTDEAIWLDTREGQTTIPRTEVIKITTHASHKRLRNTLIGFGVGVGVGTALAYGTSASDHRGVALGVSLFSVAIGTAVGALMPTSETVYINRAPRDAAH